IEKLFNSLVHERHYPGYTQPVGEHLKYIAFSHDRPIITTYLRKVIEKVSRSLEKPYTELLERLPLETAELYVLFKIDKSRGSQVLIEVPGKEFNGALGCDYFSAYRKYMKDFNIQYSRTSHTVYRHRSSCNSRNAKHKGTQIQRTDMDRYSNMCSARPFRIQFHCRSNQSLLPQPTRPFLIAGHIMIPRFP